MRTTKMDYGQEMMSAITNGHARLFPSAIRQRGVIDRTMFYNLISHEDIKNTTYRLGFCLQYATGLRSSQVSDARASHFHEVRDSHGELMCYIYTCPRQKTAGWAVEMESHYTDPSFNDELTKLIEGAEGKRDDRLVPNWDIAEACNLVKMAAPSLGWDPDMIWVNHCLRHGSAYEAAQRSTAEDRKGVLADVKKVTCHKSDRTAAEYSRSALERQLKIQCGKRKVELAQLGRNLDIPLRKPKGVDEEVRAAAPPKPDKTERYETRGRKKKEENVELAPRTRGRRSFVDFSPISAKAAKAANTALKRKKAKKG